MDVNADDPGKRKSAAAIILLAVVVIACYVERARIRAFYAEHFPDALPGMWYVMLLIAAIVVSVAANSFLKSWRVLSLEVVLLMVLSFGLIGAFIGLVFRYFWQIDEYPLWQYCMVAMTAVGALAALICLLIPERDCEGEKGYTRVNPSNDLCSNCIMEGFIFITRWRSCLVSSERDMLGIEKDRKIYRSH